LSPNTTAKMVSRIPNDIFQFSTVSALIAGLATSGPQAAQLTGYGTHGLGTFTNLDGEMIMLDGKAWHMTTSSDGQLPIVKPAGAQQMLPFVQVTKFMPAFRSALSTGFSKDELVDYFAGAGGEGGGTGGPNSFVPFSVTGSFKSVNVRIAGPRSHERENLAEVTARAKKWDLKDVKGTMFGVASPEWMQGVTVGGVHAHFLSDEGEGSGAQEVRKGGHVLGFETGEKAVLEWAVTGRYHLGFPGDENWENLDLMADTAGIRKAEG